MASCAFQPWSALRATPVLLLLAVGFIHCELVDIKPYYSLILEKHNDLRRNVSPMASDMREMMWDDALAVDAENWASKCDYRRPSTHEYAWGANMHSQEKWVDSQHSIRTNVQRGLHNWERMSSSYRYGPNCGHSCTYVQMIYSSVYRIGCGMNKCPVLQVNGRGVFTYTTLFVCFYAPKGSLVGTYPYRTGATCTECPQGTGCSKDLCVIKSTVQVPDSKPAEIPPTVPQRQPQLQPRAVGLSTDALTDEESFYILSLHNKFRNQKGYPEIKWDAALKKWTDRIVSCRADYPGPPHGYTNFYRCRDQMPIYEIVYEWEKEGTNTNLQLEKGCRTPFDRTQCNHYTNMMQQLVTSMACSACNCGDGMRQIVCIYDNQLDRKVWGS